MFYVGKCVEKLQHCYRHKGNNWMTGRGSPASDSLKIYYRYLKPGLPYRHLGNTRPILLHNQVVVGGIPLSLSRLLNCMEGMSVSR